MKDAMSLPNSHQPPGTPSRAGSSSRPPAQVFTKGATGAVKTRSRSRLSVPSGDSRSRSNRSRSSTRRTRSSSTQPRKRAESTTSSRDTNVWEIRSIGVEDLSSVGTVRTSRTNPPKHTKAAHSTAHSTTKSQRTSSKKESSSGPSYRDESPTPSIDSPKQHVRTAGKVIDDLTRAQGPERRIAAITNACAVFDHVNEGKHDVELYHGAASALSRLLLQTQDDDEIRMLCAAMEMVMRGSPRSVHGAYMQLPPSFVKILLSTLERCDSKVIRHAEVIDLSISRIFCYLSKCSEIRTELGRKREVLNMLTRVSHQPLAEDSRVAKVRMLCNLTCTEANKVVMHEHDGLLDTIVRIAHLDNSELCRQFAATALMDLTSAPINQKSMANNDKVLGTLAKMIFVEKVTVTRESVITAIQNLAFAKENRDRLVSYKSGIVLEAMKKVLSTDLESKARRRAAGALTNLACEDTCEKIGNHKGMLDALAIASSTDENPDVQLRASQALTKVATHVTLKMECFESVLDALVVASLSKSTNGVSAALRLKARESEYRESMARHPGILDTLADMVCSVGTSSKDKDNAVRTLMHLANENANRKIMCNKTILDSLVTAANYIDPDLVEARDSAIIAMERLATEVANRSSMSRHPTLLVAVSKAVEREARWEENGCDAEHGYLAKPLLMTLLLAL